MTKPTSPRRSVLMSDIAQKAGVSICTVSRVVNNHPSVSKKTRKKVERAVEEMHYIPNENARTLQRNKSKTIAFIMPDLSNPYYAELFQGAQDVMSKEGYSIFVTNTGYQEELEKNALREMSGRGVDGMILMSFYHVDDDMLRLLRACPYATVIQTPISGLDRIETTDDAGEEEAVDHLIALGHTRIAFVCLKAKNVKKRYNGYLQSLKKHGIPIREEYIIEGYTASTLGFEATQHLLNLPDPPTAIAYLNDYTVCGAYIAVREMGLRVPEDISLIGFDDLSIAQLLDPPLTTVHQPIREMGQSAARMLLNNISDLSDTRKIITLMTRFVLRKSTAPPRRTT